MYALSRGFLHELSIEGVKLFKKEIGLFARKNYGEFFSEIRRTLELNEALREKMAACLEEYFKNNAKR